MTSAEAVTTMEGITSAEAATMEVMTSVETATVESAVATVTSFCLRHTTG
jgi:hypothetical protein